MGFIQKVSNMTKKNKPLQLSFVFCFLSAVKRESLFSQYFLKSLKEPFSPKFTLTSCHNTTEKKTLNWRRGHYNYEWL